MPCSPYTRLFIIYIQHLIFFSLVISTNPLAILLAISGTVKLNEGDLYRETSLLITECAINKTPAAPMIKAYQRVWADSFSPPPTSWTDLHFFFGKYSKDGENNFGNTRDV